MYWSWKSDPVLFHVWMSICMKLVGKSKTKDWVHLKMDSRNRGQLPEGGKPWHPDIQPFQALRIPVQCLYSATQTFPQWHPSDPLRTVVLGGQLGGPRWSRGHQQRVRPEPTDFCPIPGSWLLIVFQWSWLKKHSMCCSIVEQDHWRYTGLYISWMCWSKRGWGRIGIQPWQHFCHCCRGSVHNL